MWVAWLNLENLYGQPPGEAVMALLRRALPHVNQKRLYLALLSILERTERVRDLTLGSVHTLLDSADHLCYQARPPASCAVLCPRAQRAAALFCT